MSLFIYIWIGQISFRKRETRSNWTQEIRGLQNHRKHWLCFRSRKLFLVFRKWASTGTRAVSDSQEDLWAVLANTHLRCLRKPWLVLLCLPDLMQVHKSQSRKRTFPGFLPVHKEKQWCCWDAHKQLHITAVEPTFKCAGGNLVGISLVALF